MKNFAVITLCIFFVGCAGDIAIKMPLQEVQDVNLLAIVKVKNQVF